jgi:hypothetical protein
MCSELVLIKIILKIGRNKPMPVDHFVSYAPVPIGSFGIEIPTTSPWYFSRKNWIRGATGNGIRY